MSSRTRIYPTAQQAMLCWNPGTDEVALAKWPDERGLSQRYAMTHLACWSYVRRATFDERKAIVFIEAMHLIIRDGCDPQAVHRALLGLEEYRDGCARDMPGLGDELDD